MAYLQALMTYYNRKMQRRERLRQKLIQGFSDNTDNHIEEEEEEEEEDGEDDDDDDDDNDEDEENGSKESAEAAPTSPPDYTSSPIQTEESSDVTVQESSPVSAPGIGELAQTNVSNISTNTQQKGPFQDHEHYL